MPDILLQVLNKIDLPGAEPDRVIKEIEEVCFSTRPWCHHTLNPSVSKGETLQFFSV
jgi:hypothetical protein